MRYSILFLLGMLLTGLVAFNARAEQFQPENRLSGVGVDREQILQIVRRTKYRIYKERQLVRTRRGKPVYKTVRRRVPYTVLVRDDRFNPERAVPAAARYLTRLEQKFGGRDWAVFAY